MDQAPHTYVCFYTRYIYECWPNKKYGYMRLSLFLRPQTRISIEPYIWLLVINHITLSDCEVMYIGIFLYIQVFNTAAILFSSAWVMKLLDEI